MGFDVKVAASSRVTIVKSFTKMALELTNGLSSQRSFHPNQSCVRPSVPPHLSLRRKEEEEVDPPLQQRRRFLNQESKLQPILCICIWATDTYTIAHQYDRGIGSKPEHVGGVSFFIIWNFKRRIISQRTLLVLAHTQFYLAIQNQLIPD